MILQFFKSFPLNHCDLKFDKTKSNLFKSKTECVMIICLKSTFYINSRSKIEQISQFKCHNLMIELQFSK